MGPLGHESSIPEASRGQETLAADAALDESDAATLSTSKAGINSARPLQRLDVGLQLARLNNGGGEGALQTLMSSTAVAEQSAQTARVLTRIAPVSRKQCFLVVVIRSTSSFFSQLRVLFREISNEEK